MGEQVRPLIGIPTRTIQQEGMVFHGIASTYTRALELAGAAPVLIPLRVGEETLRATFERIDGLLLAGGVDIHPSEFGEPVETYCGEIMPERDAVELQVTRWALAQKMPVLGICRGIQTLNVAAGGSLFQDIPALIPGALHHSHRPGDPYDLRVHSIEIEPGSRLADALGETRVKVNSLHHQSVRAVAPGFHVVARAPDGVVEGIEADGDQFALAVQFHPEWLVTDQRMVDIFRKLMQAARLAAQFRLP